jgi:hypothetical protein
MGAVHCVVNNASLFSEDSASSFTYTSARPTHARQSGCTADPGTGAACQPPEGQQACVINLLDQKLFNLNPDFYRIPCPKLHYNARPRRWHRRWHRVRVVGMAPGITMVSGHQSEADFQQAHQVTPLGRSSTPEDIARTVCFVADSPAMTGTTLLVDGGQHLIPLQRDVMYLATANQSRFLPESERLYVIRYAPSATRRLPPSVFAELRNLDQYRRSRV